METLVALYANNPNVPHNSEQPEIISLNIAFIAVTIAIVTLRIVVRTFIVKHVALEDYLMIAAGVFGVAFSSLNIAGTHFGLGRHVYDLDLTNLIPTVKRIIQTLWVCQTLYTTALALVKLSIIASFHRIFPTRDIRYTLYTIGGLIVAVWIVGIFCTIFQCTPIYAAWDFEAALLPTSHCLPIMKVYYFTTAFSILTDLILCILPLPLFWKLKLPQREKWIVSGLFAFGLVAAVASVMRITTLNGVQQPDFSIGAVPTLNWSVVELGTGIICACIPCLKPLFKRLLPGRFFSTAGGQGGRRSGGGTGRMASRRISVVPSNRGQSRHAAGESVPEDTEMMHVMRAQSIAGKVPLPEVTVVHGSGEKMSMQKSRIESREFV